MRNLPAQPARATLQDVLRKLEAWRKRADRKKRIPEELWDAAASLCLEHSVHTVSKTLRLNYDDLKKHVKRIDCPDPAPVFADLGCIPPATELVVECEDGCGRRMRIHYRGLQAEQITPGLLKGFWGSGQ